MNAFLCTTDPQQPVSVKKFVGKCQCAIMENTRGCAMGSANALEKCWNQAVAADNSATVGRNTFQTRCCNLITFLCSNE